MLLFNPVSHTRVLTAGISHDPSQKNSPGVNFTMRVAEVFSKETDRNANSYYIREEQQQTKQWKVLDR